MNFEIEKHKSNYILNSKIIPLIVEEDIEKSKLICKSVLNSGCRVIEYGIRYENSLKNFSILSNFLKKEFNDFSFGAGSVTDIETANKIIQIGADFIISPGFSIEINKLCIESKVNYIPGCATVTEMINAKSSGAKLIKIFPADHLGGIDFLKSVKSALPWLKAVPSGGILANSESIKCWFKSGAHAVTLGSDLFKKELICNENYDEIKNTLENLLKETQL